ncbi:uncharacterized protein (DUF2236 family) [Diaminobutyricimonas aerilata]|uniref:Uncharacterized protein (DUF2236 family) n=1 Tax=Diaminobutyricimonas aerilata TaxID=1162967 RepID=A0A2M9CIY9_9MICO|nr:oxygenase MpaB family protein [Diaminobutyricimonas aerilata]PJJ71871.1 uncharacterized protein (DUF2236 family) [Diaminobutyricimonas aerilata]
MFSGEPDGSPPWVRELEAGDDAGFFGPGSAVWAVHGGTATLVAGIRALLMQTLHPGAMAGVHDWSRYREDPLGRLAGTVRWVITTTFADRAGALRASARVSRLHERVHGEYIAHDGASTDYSANDAELVEWVHCAFTESFLVCHEIWGGPIPGGSDAYVREWAAAGTAMGLPEPPTDRRGLERRLAHLGPRLRGDDRVREAIAFIRRPPLPAGTMLGYRVLFAGAVASLPPAHRRLLGLRRPWWPAVTATRLVLWLVERILGRPSTSELAARRRLARLDRERDASGTGGVSP